MLGQVSRGQMQVSGKCKFSEKLPQNCHKGGGRPPTPRLEARLLGLMLRLLIEGDPVGAVLAAAKLELRVLDLGVGALPLVGVLGRRGGGGGAAVDLVEGKCRRKCSMDISKCFRKCFGAKRKC